ncbi:sporulation factor SpoIIGA, Unknown type peptidase, MEROPS family U04 [Desulforamulus reducens MI-1]|uniref:Sporulation sigma-E factor-processing peptidase n=1 Tax=Desulforamulus reducens (strain ATCC BAA-1160 / DSM 100696 / MI-1) TaxID=349161 RepID=A4J2C1_DESRM|nr:sigma-E processing peptidase SpoIIGA [Desulforamulus reducens]ABO49224.1 sporulation factor SpoIIGA, Unknown type peptidase, MEROPS family U04 [Desulforamulus reducens MI-1]
MKQVVYLDEVIFVNLLMNLTVLWLTSRFTGNKLSFVRGLAAASVGCIYALVVLIPGTVVIKHILIKLTITMLMVLIAFRYKGWKKFAGDFLCLFLTGFFVGGLALGLHYLLVSNFANLSNTQLSANYHRWFVLMVTIILSFCVGNWGASIWHKRMGLIDNRVPLTVNLWGNRISVQALVDTGNHLVDPLSHYPVIIMEYEAIKPLLPNEISRLYSEGISQDGSDMLTLLSASPYAQRLRLIPFHSLGNNHGMLLGIRPDDIEVCYKNKIQRIQNVVVGIYEKKLSPGTTYRALLHPQLLAF